MDVMVHRNRSRGEQELYPHDVAVFEFVHLGTDPRILDVALRERNDRRLPVFKCGDRFCAGRHYFANNIHICAAPSIDSDMIQYCI